MSPPERKNLTNKRFSLLMDGKLISSLKLIFIFMILISIECNCQLEQEQEQQQQQQQQQQQNLSQTNQQEQEQERENFEKKFNELCRDINNIKHLSKMQQLINYVKETSMKNQQQQQQENNNKFFQNSFAYLFKVNPTKHCLKHSSEILDLEDLIRENVNVCKLSHIDKINNYMNKHIIGISNRRSIARKFFYLYANQVSLKCKQNLLYSLTVAKLELENQINEDDYSKIVPWLNGKLSEICSDNNNNNNNNGETKQFELSKKKMFECKAVKTLELIDTIEKLSQAIDNRQEQQQQQQQTSSFNNNNSSKNIEFGFNSTTISSTNIGSNNSSTLLESSPEIIPEHLKEKVYSVQDICLKLRPIYGNTVLPIVRLVQLNLNTPYKEFDETCSKEKIIKLWFSLTLICESSLTSNSAVNLIENINQTNSIKQINNSIEVPKFIDNNTIEDELWIGSYYHSGGSINAIKNGFGKLMKTLKIDQLSDNVVFQEGVKTTGDIIFGLLIAGLSLAGIATNIN